MSLSQTATQSTLGFGLLGGLLQTPSRPGSWQLCPSGQFWLLRHPASHTALLQCWPAWHTNTPHSVCPDCSRATPVPSLVSAAHAATRQNANPKTDRTNGMETPSSNGGAGPYQTSPQMHPNDQGPSRKLFSYTHWVSATVNFGVALTAPGSLERRVSGEQPLRARPSSMRLNSRRRIPNRLRGLGREGQPFALRLGPACLHCSSAFRVHEQKRAVSACVPSHFSTRPEAASQVAWAPLREARRHRHTVPCHKALERSLDRSGSLRARPRVHRSQNVTERW